MELTRVDYDVDPEWADFFTGEARPESSVVGTLGDVAIFDLLSTEDLRRLARVVHVRHFTPGEVIIQAGVPQSGIYVIRSGSVEIVQPRREGDAEPETVGVLGPGEIVGEFSIVDGAPRSSSLVASEPSELIGFFRPDLLDILRTQPGMGCRILLRIGEEMTRTLNSAYAALRKCGYPLSQGEAVPLAEGTSP